MADDIGADVGALRSVFRDDVTAQVVVLDSIARKSRSGEQASAPDRESRIWAEILRRPRKSAPHQSRARPRVGRAGSKHRARLGDARVVVSMGWLPRLHPMLKAGLTSGTIMSGGDLICQTIEQRSRTFQADTPPFAVRGVDPAEEASTSGRTSGVVSAVQERMGLANYDLVRTARFFGVGLTLHGPFFK
jgi:hypothetical protein